ncbi:MAG: type III toxin-antitoxin system ToxN/AbiQ family toxin [Evtepia sp.]|uniref:type III toxin-antitoxin system ToxN/AbiQ family toxin n=1 Tax=Evtepia sp. TaxID=2773933 RepID=UPI002A7569D1|nr:type III toxin-antitoxin system ToxN/AbiQ family toxin [Evtepia sp.]MDY3015360.1 type III toxin-antitoxin system ToxN/AbiQ family toxin [Evtepia sp.]
MDQLKIYRIADKYIRFLRSIDQRVQYNKNARRPYVGVVLIVGSYRYFVPMESPKENHKAIKPSKHIFPIDSGKYGILGFNNMLPVPSDALELIQIEAENDRKYAELLKRQISFINRNKAEIYDRAQKTYFRATTKNKNSFFRKICCDFKRLERASNQYRSSFQQD